MRIQWLAAITAVVAATGIAQAQPAKQTLPTVELRVHSVNDLLDKAEFVGGLAGKEDIVKAVKAIVKNLTKEKTGLEGVDPKRPFGLYANPNVDIVNSPVVLMVPIADKDRFLKMLKDRAEIVPEKAEDDTLKAVSIPIVSELYLRFTNDYLYVGRTVKDLDPKTLISPKTFFARDEKAIVSLVVRFDLIPEDAKKMVLGQFELFAAEQRRMNGAKEDPIEKAFLDLLVDGMSNGLNTFLEDAKELHGRVFIDDKNDELSAEVTLSAKPGSTMARTLASFAGKSSMPLAIVGAGKDPAIIASAKGGLTPELKKRFAKVIDDVTEEFTKRVDPNARSIVEQAFVVIGPTLKAAEVDGAIAVYGPDAKKHYNLLVAGSVKQGKGFEKLLKELALSAGAVADFDFDVEKIGDFALHRIELTQGPGELEQLLGTRKFWVAISDNYLVISIEPEGTRIREGLKAKAKADVPIASVNISTAQLLPLMAKELKPDEIKAVLKDAFGDESPAGKDTIAVTLSASGDQLTLKAKVKGKAVRLFFALDEFRKK